MPRIEPGMPRAVVRASNELYRKGDEIVRGNDITIPPDQLDEFRHGYRCIRCLAAQIGGDGLPVAFPKECVEPYCRFPIRDEQPKVFEQQYQGEEELWPEDRFGEGDPERDAYERRTPGGVWLP